MLRRALCRGVQQGAVKGAVQGARGVLAGAVQGAVGARKMLCRVQQGTAGPHPGAREVLCRGGCCARCSKVQERCRYRAGSDGIIPHDAAVANVRLNKGIKEFLSRNEI